jgi:dihydroorotate dehydrogenase electron transfer subunit
MTVDTRAKGMSKRRETREQMPTAPPQLQTATIVSREYRPPGFWCVGLCCPAVARHARPAQFVAIDIVGGFMVRLPLGVFTVDGDDFTLIFQEWGDRTTRLAHAAVGETVSCIGPLGNEFDLPPAGSRAIIAAGGLGVSPFWLLARELRDAHVDTTIVLGARSKDYLVGARDLGTHGFPIEICTDDGSSGFHGTVIDRVRQLPRPDITYACGPPGMLRALCTFAGKENARCQISMEETFGCSMGTCWGCVVAVRRGSKQGTGYPRASGEQRDYDFARVCADGTVFDAANVVWRD